MVIMRMEWSARDSHAVDRIEIGILISMTFPNIRICEINGQFPIMHCTNFRSIATMK